jgi:hypothetical protein
MRNPLNQYLFYFLQEMNFINAMKSYGFPIFFLFIFFIQPVGRGGLIESLITLLFFLFITRATTPEQQSVLNDVYISPPVINHVP